MPMAALVAPSGSGHVATALTSPPCDLQGQRWEQIKPHFEEFWSMTFRVLDDVKVLAPISYLNNKRPCDPAACQMAFQASEQDTRARSGLFEPGGTRSMTGVRLLSQRSCEAPRSRVYARLVC